MSIKELPSMEHSFTIKIKGDDTPKTYEGTFTYKRPNLKSQSNIAKTAAMLDGGVANLDEDTKFLHTVLATLRHTIIKFPEWWEESDFGFDLYDVNVLFELYKECRKFEDSWMKKVWGNQEDKSEKKESDEGKGQKGA